MLTLKVAAGERFPVGTVVSLYGDDHELQFRERQPPAGDPLATATVDTKLGGAVFEDVEWSTGYYAYALVNGEHRWAQTRTIDPSRRIRPTEVYEEAADETADAFEYIDRDGYTVLFLDEEGGFGSGPNPSKRQQGHIPDNLPAIDFYVDAHPIKGKFGKGDRGGTGRTFMRTFSCMMVNDPSDGNMHRAEGSPTGNFFSDVFTYTAGTVTATNGSNIITGVGTLWATEVGGRPNVREGDKITIAGDSQTRTVYSVNSNTEIRLHAPYDGPTGAGKTYNAGGKVTVEHANKTVVGEGTGWTKELVGDSFVIPALGSIHYRIVSVNEEAQTLELNEGFGETSAGSQAYTIGFDGFPYGKNGDGSQLYPCKAGSILATFEGVPFQPHGDFNGGVARISYQCADDPMTHTLTTTVAVTAWSPGDSTLRVVHDPAAWPIPRLDNQGEDQGTHEIRDHGYVSVVQDDGKVAVVTYKAAVFDAGVGKLLGCTDVNGTVGASVGKKVTQIFQQVSGEIGLVTNPSGGYRYGRASWTVKEDSSMTFGSQAETGGQTAWHMLRGGSARIDTMAAPSSPTYEFVGVGPGSTERNYYFIFKNSSPGADYADHTVVKVNVPNGQNAYGTSNYLAFTFANLPFGWLTYDIVKVPATAGADSGTYQSIAENVSVLHDSRSGKVVAVDYGQVVTNPYVMPDSNRDTTADLRVQGFIRGEGGRAGGVRRITATTTDGRVAGQQFTIDGREEFVSVETTTAPLDIYLPKSSSVPGRIIEIGDRGGNAAANPFTIRAFSGDNINGSATFVVNQNRGAVRMFSNGAGGWIAIAGISIAGISGSILDAKGDLITATANDTPVRKAVGANNRLLAADSAQSDGLIWRQVVNADVDAAAAIADSKINLANVDARWRRLKDVTGRMSATTVTAQALYVVQNAAGVVLPATASAVPIVVSIKASELAIAGRTTQLRMVVVFGVNATAPAMTSTFGLYAVGTPVGAANVWDPALGASPVTGSGVAFASPAASSKSAEVSSGVFALPADGWYVFAVAAGAAMAASSNCVFNIRLEVQNV